MELKKAEEKKLKEDLLAAQKAEELAKTQDEIDDAREKNQ